VYNRSMSLGSTESPGPDAIASMRAIFVEAGPEGSTADRVHLVLTSAIERGGLEPGTRLAEETLAKAFSVSRTPIREALVRLEAEGLADRDRHGRLFVGGITVDQIVEVYAVREALDGAAARLAAAHADPLDLQRLRRVNEEMVEAAREGRYENMAEMNIEFHSLLARAGKNLMLVSFIGQIHSFVRRFDSTTFTYSERAVSAVTEHEAILAALERHDGSAAESLARDHMRKALDVRILMEADRSHPKRTIRSL